MYLDPGVTGMAVQAFFALVAALLTTLSAPRTTIRNLAQKIRGFFSGAK